MRNPFFALLTLFLATLAPVLPAQDFDPFADLGGGDSTSTKSEVFSTSKAITPGQSFEVVLKLTHPEGWHSYYQNPGIGIPSLIPTITWILPEGFVAGDLQWPNPHRSEFVGLKSQGYEGTNYFVTTITAPDSVTVGETIKIVGDAEWQMCKESCINEKTSFTVELAVNETANADDARSAELAEYATSHLPAPTPEAWDLSATDDGDTLTLTIRNAGELPKGLFLFDQDGQVDAQTEQTFVQNADESWTLKVPRNKGNQLSDTVGPVLSTLNGILTAEEEIPGTGRHGVNLEVKFGEQNMATAPDETPAPSAHAPPHIDTPEEIAEMAKLYHPETKIDFITLRDIPKATLLSALFGAFIGGMILNLMPCVFPVLGLKVMSFVEQAGNEPKKVRIHGMAFTLGLMASMWVLAGTLLVLKLSFGKSVNWGAQMGNPYFVAAIVILLFVLGLNMAGVFEIGTKLTSAGGKLQQKKGYSGSFFSGVLTTLIATPCSGPFLGAAMAYTLAQSAPVAMFLFSIFALGIAFPYLLLSFFPALINKLPRPGAWMETFKVLMSFALFGTAAFFLRTFGTQTGVGGMSWFLMALVILGLAAYCYGRWSLPHLKKSSRRWFGFAMPIGFAALGFWMAFDAASQKGTKELNHAGGLAWNSWQPGKVELSRSKGRIVWVDYTADW